MVAGASLVHAKRHPKAMGAAEVTAFSTHLAVARLAAPSTEGQARSAWLFLYRQVLGLDLPGPDEIVAAKVWRRLRVVLTPGVVRALLLERAERQPAFRHVAALQHRHGLA